jgi:hypothetical protein
MVFKVKSWSHILIEGFCMINVDYEGKHSKWVYGWEGNEDPTKRGKYPNPQYDKSAKPDKKPKYCKGHICPDCIQESKLCPHLAYAPVEKELKDKFTTLVHEYFKEEDEKT